jgi:hypothetical protein
MPSKHAGSGRGGRFLNFLQIYAGTDEQQTIAIAKDLLKG